MTIESIPAGLNTGVWNLDNSHSEVGFSVRHAGISKVRGKFGEVTATATVGETLGDSSVTVSIKAESFSSGDANRDAHVRSGDFLDSEQFPELTFTSTSISGQGETYALNGDLTIRGVSHPVTFETEFNGAVVDPFGTSRAGFSGQTTISRKEFGLTWNAALEAGGVLVGDKVTISIEAEFVAG